MNNLLKYILITLIPLRDWSFDKYFTLYAIDLVAVVVALVYLYDLSLGRVKLNRYASIFSWNLISGSLVTILTILYGIDYFFHSLIGLLINVIYFLTLLSVLQFLADRKGGSKVIKFQLFYCFFISILSLCNFFNNSLNGVDYIGDFFDYISLHTINESHLELTLWIRNSSFTGEPNFLGMYMCLNLLMLRFSNLGSVVVEVFSIVFLFVIISTFSRAAIIIGLLIYVIYKVVDIVSVKNNIILIATAAMVVFLISYFGDYAEATIDSLNNRDFTGDSNRAKIRMEAYEVFLNYPLGVGLTNYYRMGANILGANMEPNAHNGFLTILVEQGWLGLLFIFYSLILLINEAFKKFGLVYAICLITILCSNMVNNNDKILGFFILLILPIAITYNDKNK